MDTNIKGKRAEYWEETATSYERRNKISYRKQYYAEGTNTTRLDRGVYRQRNEGEITGDWDRRMSIDRKERYSREDYYRNYYNHYNQERYWQENTVQCGRQNKGRQEYSWKEFEQINYSIFDREGDWTGETVYFRPSQTRNKHYKITERKFSMKVNGTSMIETELL